MEQRSINENRYLILADLIQEISKNSNNPSIALLHDYILFCRLKSPEASKLIDYNFRAYMRGAFSEQLQIDIEELYTRNWIRLIDGKPTVGEHNRSNGNNTDDLRHIKILCTQLLKDKSPHDISKELREVLIDKKLGEEIPV